MTKNDKLVNICGNCKHLYIGKRLNPLDIDYDPDNNKMCHCRKVESAAKRFDLERVYLIWANREICSCKYFIKIKR